MHIDAGQMRPQRLASGLNGEIRLSDRTYVGIGNSRTTREPVLPASCVGDSAPKTRTKPSLKRIFWRCY